MFVSCTQESGCTHVAQIKGRRAMPKYARNATTTKLAPGWASSAVGPTLDITSLVSEKTGHLRTGFFSFFFFLLFRKATPPIGLVHGVDGGAGTWLGAPEISNRSLSSSLSCWLTPVEIWRTSWQSICHCLIDVVANSHLSVQLDKRNPFSITFFCAGILYETIFVYNNYYDQCLLEVYSSWSSSALRCRPFPTSPNFLNQ